MVGNIDQRETIILESKKKLEQLEYKMYLVRELAQQYLCPVFGNTEYVTLGDRDFTSGFRRTHLG